MARFVFPAFVAGAILLLFIANDVAAQRPTRRSPRPAPSAGSSENAKKSTSKTTVTVEILTSPDGLGVRGQTLRPLFEDLGYSVRIREGSSQDEVETREKTYGKLREVHVVGRLDEKGRLVFADRTFSTSDTKQIREWLRELETYGAQGTPENKPLWGMTDPQFKEVHTTLAEKVDKDIQGEPFETALTSLALPAQYQLRVSTEASDWLKQTFPKVPPVRHTLKGCSKGTALAIVTNEYGLGFRPLRTPEGSIELVIDPLTKSTDVWPIGWEPNRRENEVVPKLYELNPVEFNNKTLTEIFDSISNETGIPIRVDYFGIGTQGLQLESLRSTQKRQKVPLSRVLGRVTNPHRLQSHVRIDEANQPFVWISILIPARRRGQKIDSRIRGVSMITGEEIIRYLTDVGITHVVWVPDSTFGQWYEALRDSPTIRLVGVCREGEAWATAAGLYLGGAVPLVMIQCTGLFESGDALRNALHDYKLPLLAMIGYRSYLNQDTLPGDTARIFTEPILKAWNLEYEFIDEPAKKHRIREHWSKCRELGKPGIVLLAEGKA